MKGGVKPTLVDAVDPTPLFWHYAGDTLLVTPVGIDAWVAGRAHNPWVHSWVPPTPAAIMLERVNDSPELKALAQLAVDAGPEGRTLLKRIVAERLDAYIDVLSVQESLCTPEPNPSVIQPERIANDAP